MAFLPFFSAETWTLLAVLLTLFVVYGKWSFGVFEKLGIPGPKPLMYWGTITRHNKVYYLADLECAKKYGQVFGLYELRKPMLTVLDPDMLKTILVKECFTHFTNRRNFRLNGELYDAVSLAENDQWRRIRNILSPSFTSGRIKEMFDIMKLHSRSLTDSLATKVLSDDIIAPKDFFGPYSLDVLFSCAFSVDCDSLHNPSEPMVTHAAKLFRINVPLFLVQGFFPFLLPLLEMLGLSVFPASAIKHFGSVVKKIKTERPSHTNQRVDFLQLMMNSQTDNHSNGEEKDKGLSDHEIMSQATIFIVAGSETSSVTLTFLAYNLAKNPDVMERLQEEIDSTFPGKAPVQYEALVEMEYLDSVVNETLRLYPPGARLERVAKETVEVNGITIPKGMLVMIPVYALHRDPDIWPEPETFKPERFSKANKQNINPYTYLPFGAGPRNCIGMRFALVMIKLALVETLRNYSFSVCKETELDLEMDTQGIIGPLRPIKLKIVPRSTRPGHEE